MQKLKIRLPATLTNLGPAVHSLGLAVSLYTTIEISRRDDTQVNIRPVGESNDSLESLLMHPVLLAMSRLFQHFERSASGFDVTVDSQIPLRSGLCAESAFTVAGVLGANDLLGNPLKRDDLLAKAASFDRPDSVTASLLGGLTVSFLDDDQLVYTNLPIERFQVVLVYPHQEGYAAPGLPEQISWQDHTRALSQFPLLLDAFRRGDLPTIARLLDKSDHAKHVSEKIAGFGHVKEVARRRGAIAVVPIGDGPTVMAVAASRHEAIAEEMVMAFRAAGSEAKSWVVPVDTQGVVISAVQST